MAVSRTTTARTLGRLSFQATQVRSLHMTGSAAAARLPTTEKAGTVQSKPAQDTVEPFHPYSPSTTTRHFNTSRVLKRVGDSSTIDFAYLPTFPTPALLTVSEISALRVPILPNTTSATVARANDPAIQADTFMPTISTAALESTHIHAPSALSDVHDGAEHHATDFHDIIDTIGSGADFVREAARKVALGHESGEEGNKAKGLLKGVWTGLLHDLYGPKASMPTVKV